MLGGGLAKIGATLILCELYDPDFGILHTSTFGEDELSCCTATRFLDQLTGQDAAWLRRIPANWARRSCENSRAWRRSIRTLSRTCAAAA